MISEYPHCLNELLRESENDEPTPVIPAQLPTNVDPGYVPSYLREEASDV